MNNKTLAEAQFCSNENLNYLTYELNWTKDRDDLKKTVRKFMYNYKSQISNYMDPWKSVRYLNRLFILNIDVNPSTETLYSTPAEAVLFTEEIFR